MYFLKIVKQEPLFSLSPLSSCFHSPQRAVPALSEQDPPVYYADFLISTFPLWVVLLSPCHYITRVPVPRASDRVFLAVL